MRKIFALAILALVALLGFALAGPAAAASVEPAFVAGNPSCTSLGYQYGFKVDPPNSGTYDIDGVNTVTVSTDGIYFDWSSTLGMDAVIAKGGPNANVYVYDPPAESFGDTGLNSPINASNGNPYGLSHIEFCYDYNVVVEKTAETSFTRTFEWDIDKSVIPDTWDLFTGDSGTSEYTVEVTKTGYTDSNWAVSGEISIFNPAPSAATIASVSDAISGLGAVVVDCGVSFPYELASNDTLVCTYASALPDGTNRINTATVATSGAVGGGSDSADVIFGDPTTLVNDTINVNDTNGQSWMFGDSGSVSYSRTFTCDGDEGTHGNTATIVETGQSDSASVTVNCYALGVTKDADTSFTRTWDWTIVKDADQTQLLLSEGQSFVVNYAVTVDATSTDSDFAVEGQITINNPAPMDANLTAVSDIISPAIAASVNCPSLLVPAGGLLVCSYDTDLPDAADRLNTATATLQNYDYDSEGIGTASGTTDFTGSANVIFGAVPTLEIDECIDVNDTNVGFLGTVCADDVLPKTFIYSLDFGTAADNDVVLVCGENTHTNIADFLTNDTQTAGNDDHTVVATVACDNGCTLTPGYWKTHSEYGPARYDDTWALLGGADTAFFLSGMSYYDVLWTAPQGDAYYILAHAYIAAELNLLNGSSSTAGVDAAFAWATNFFTSQAPGQKLSKALRAEVIANAQILDDYNNGLLGPGHCSE